MLDLETRLEEFVARCAGIDPAHDILHVKRVVANAKAFALEEEHVSDRVLVAASWLHDVISLDGDDGIRVPSSVRSATLAANFLREEKLLDAVEIDKVHHAIAAHSLTAGIVPATVEARILSDADRIDALGAIGIARCVIVGGRFGAKLYDDNDPFPTGREIDDRKYIIDHFYSRLFRLEETFFTKAGTREAARRTEYMRNYIEQLKREVA